MSPVVFSEYQNAIFEWAEHDSGHALVNAVAGSGKTFTLVETMKRIKGRSVFLAFNKSIADELSKKVPSHVRACTLHSMGFSAVRYAFGKVQVDGDKVDKIMDAVQALRLYRGMKLAERNRVLSDRAVVKRLVSIVKMTLANINSTEEVEKTADFYGIDYAPELLGHVRAVYQKSIDMKGIIDFDDMIFFPVHYGMRMLQYEWVFVDESQDLNRCQIEMVLKLAKPKYGRIVAVGDPRQSIYGFRAADSEAMNRIREALNARELPLSVCYRCPTSHIDRAQSIVPHIEARPGADEGEILDIKEEQFESEVVKEIDKNPLVLCRINAPLMQYALSLIAAGHKATIKGRDIAKSLLTIVNNINGSSIEDCYQGIRDWESKNLRRLAKKDAPERQLAAVRDKAATLIAIAESCDSKGCIIRKIETIFTDDHVDGVEFSTVHRAKGLESDTVYILLPNLLPLVRSDQQEWELEQEYNIKYVALTRAKQKLTFVRKGN